MSTLENVVLHLRVLYGTLVGLAFMLFGSFYPSLNVKRTNLSGRVVIVTGANSGIGYEISKQLAGMGATVYLACRNASKGKKALDELSNAVPNADVKLVELDTASFASVRAFASAWSKSGVRINILVHNAGIPSPPQNKPFTADGFDSIYQINFLSSFLLTHLLEKHLAPTARVIFTTSHASYGGSINTKFSLQRQQNTVETGFHTADKASPMAYYCNTKLMQVVFARALQRRWRVDAETRGRVAAAFSPGYTATAIFAEETMGPTSWRSGPIAAYLKAAQAFTIPAEQGARTGVFLATSGEEVVTGVDAGAYWERARRLLNQADVFSNEELDRFWIRWSADAGIEWL